MNHINQGHPRYLDGERSANEDLDGRGSDACVPAWVRLGERVQALAESRGDVGAQHQIAGYLHTLRDHLAEQST